MAEGAWRKGPGVEPEAGEGRQGEGGCYGVAGVHEDGMGEAEGGAVCVSGVIFPWRG